MADGGDSRVHDLTPAGRGARAGGWPRAAGRRARAQRGRGRALSAGRGGAAVELRSGRHPGPAGPAGGVRLPLGPALDHRFAGRAGAGLSLRRPSGRRHPGLEGRRARTPKPTDRPPELRESPMRRTFAIAAAAVALLWTAAAGAQGRRQRLQLVGLYRAERARGFHQGDRHQGALRHLRFQRYAGDQAARRQVRLRRGGADRLLPRAPDQGRGLPEARQEQAAQSGQPVARDRAAARRPRSRQPVRRQLHVGHHRDRLQRQEGARDSRGRRQDRQLGHRVQAGDPGQVQGLRRLSARFLRRHPAGGAEISRLRSQFAQRRPSCRRRPIW